MQLSTRIGHCCSSQQSHRKSVKDSPITVQPYLVLPDVFVESLKVFIEHQAAGIVNTAQAMTEENSRLAEIWNGCVSIIAD
jgi:hypothetical protein